MASVLLKDKIELAINIDDYYKYTEYNFELDFLDEYYLSNNSRLEQFGFHITHLLYHPTIYGTIKLNSLYDKVKLDKCIHFFLKTIDKIKNINFDLYLEYIHCLQMLGYQGIEVTKCHKLVKETYIKNLSLNNNTSGSISNPELKPTTIDYYNYTKEQRSLLCDNLYLYTHPTAIYLASGTFDNLKDSINLDDLELHQGLP